MKSVVKILVILIMVIVLGTTVYGTSEENTVTNNVVSNETVKEEKQEPEEPTETKMNETMYVQERCNIRASYSVESDRVGGLDVGTEVTVLAEYSNGWYKIKYDDGEAYIKSAILRSTKPEMPDNEEENETEEAKPDQNQAEEPTQNTVPQENVVAPEVSAPAEDNVTTDLPENSEEVSIEDAELINEIGVLPEVGKNIADYLFWGAIALAIIAVIIIKYKDL